MLNFEIAISVLSEIFKNNNFVTAAAEADINDLSENAFALAVPYSAMDGNPLLNMHVHIFNSICGVVIDRQLWTFV